MIHRIYVRDTFTAFTEQDQALIADRVLGSGISVDGMWMWIDLDTLGTCLRATVDSVVANGHPNLSIKRNPDLDSIVWVENEAKEDMGMDSEEVVGLDELQGMDGVEAFRSEEE